MLSVAVLNVIMPSIAVPGWPDDSEKNHPIFWKVAKTVAKPNNAKLQNLLLNTLFWWHCYELVAQDIEFNFWGLLLQWAYKKLPNWWKITQSGHPDAECHYVECCISYVYAGCCHSEHCNAELSVIIMLNVTFSFCLLNVLRLHVAFS